MAMSTNMIDSIHATCHNIPTGTRKVAGYVTGSADIRWRRADWDRFSPRHTGLVRIDQSFGGRAPSAATCWTWSGGQPHPAS
jgi:hypothetical protein